jgi:magnesium-transporting ATPase (P-type)
MLRFHFPYLKRGRKRSINRQEYVKTSRKGGKNELKETRHYSFGGKFCNNSTEFLLSRK